ncbi:MAG: SPOR domain-containing protein [Thiovulaceae bacterium]|jgi:DedD protein|nr:SPOR domain-containing protein [Sulfurimonadaceae bacterium]MDD3817596.1 SPOR domain-containing protein [Sulfurimonadaceae bacterium]
MEEKNELNDIILNKGNGANQNKKIILAVATLGIVLIIVVMLMNSLSSSGTDNLPQAVLPPEPKIAQTTPQAEEDPLFEEVEVVQENTQTNDNLDQIAQKLKAESRQEAEVVATPVAEEEIKPQPVKEEVKKAVAQPKPAQQQAQTKPATGSYYIQVGSFATYEPNKAFLKSITDKGFKYTYHKVHANGKTINKVLVGPFGSEKEARSALRSVRTSIEAGAFLTKI